MPHSRLVLQSYQFLFKLSSRASHSSRSKAVWVPRAKQHTNGFFHMLKPKSLKELLEHLEIESFITCLGKLWSVLYSTVLPMFEDTSGHE